MERKDWLLLAVSDGIQPIQLQKTLFKFANESGAPENELYSFVPYNWGPCSFQIYEDLAELRREGTIEFVPTDRGWNLYRQTKDGITKEKELREKAKPTILKKLDESRNYVTSRTFEVLLHDIYHDYPAFAAKSLFVNR